MGNKLSIISFDTPSELDHTPIQSYSLSNSAVPPPPGFSLEYPFLVKGMLFGICLKGSTTLRIDFKEHTITPYSVFTILPNQIFEAFNKSDDLYIEFLFFSTEFVSNLPLPKDFDILNNMTHCPCLSVSEENMNELMEYHSFIVKVCNNKTRIHHEEITKSLMYAFIALTTSLYWETEAETELESGSRGTMIADEFSKLLTTYHKTERKASFYSGKLCITTQYLSRTLKRITGRSVNEWIIEAVILEAKALLKSSDMSIAQLSEELNFPNPSFFVRYFKQYAGITPMKYRNI